VIAVDTNILVYAHRAESEWHEGALRQMLGLTESKARWAIPWPCVHEFLVIVTHPRVYDPPTPLAAALESISVWLAAENCIAISEGPGYMELFRQLAGKGQIAGDQIHDARIAALCLHHGVSVLWSSDRDFSRYPELKLHNPLVSRA
jgi:toxin-antitoxin system PIN domain toxin